MIKAFTLGKETFLLQIIMMHLKFKYATILVYPQLPKIMKTMHFFYLNEIPWDGYLVDKPIR